ncbi:ABC transporter ATP-binding protein [Halalkalibacter sp. APA_J-10(15)]|uniref:ABC transporter ATP-binding protein n=1 Tax=unclassified Halalkalibacter TaxID=2893063 RepID=UPI001FF5F3C3|nr:oligopeptide/dipeptide ABC transporter ATP-binding protein [Halalkalibacter sp. APA_J-10(15)]MCK0470218.1 ATP-binding cassette domain-containing protein [Halalkalibacter sp. APA_J-10(15)]
MSETILEIEHLSKEFKEKKSSQVVKAVSDISFSLRKGETLSLVGESGCGKTTLGRCIVRGIESTAGHVYFYGSGARKVDFLTLKSRAYKEVRPDIQMIFQDPYSSLNPRMTVFDIISEPLRAMKRFSKQDIEDRVKNIARKTGLNVSYLKRYPHSFSGGQRQRIGIARALVTEPKIIVCDEAVSALDVSIQAQIINLLKDLQEEFNVTYLFISHDLSVVEHISDRVAVMYLGEIIELANTNDLYERPMHPYTEALLSAVPKANPDLKTNRKVLTGEVPNPANRPSGCHFHPRCAYRTEKCEHVAPTLTEIEDGRSVSCHYANELKLQGVFQ